MRYNFLNLSRGITLFTWSKTQLTLRFKASPGKSPPCLVWCPWVFYKWKYNIYLIDHVASQDHVIKGSCGFIKVAFNDISPPWQDCDWRFYVFVSWHYVTTSLKVCMNLWMEGPYLLINHHLAMFGGHWSSASWDIIYLVCHVISQEHVIEGSCDLLNGTSSPPWQVWWPYCSSGGYIFDLPMWL